jgi:uncharacterized membrane protein
MSTNATAPAPAAEDLKPTQPSRHLPAGAGVTWISEGWKLFAKAPLMWIVAILVVCVIWLVVGIIPLIGGVAIHILSPVFTAGLLLGCRSLEKGGELELEHVFAGFKSPRFMNLVILGLIMLGALIVIFVSVGVAFFVAFGATLLSAGAQDAMDTIMASAMAASLGLLLILALLLPLLAAYWYAPALIVLSGVSPVEAMKESFFGSFKNFLPLAVYGIVMFVLSILAAIPIGLGFLVLIPLAMTSTYASYRAIFTEP